MMPEDSGGGVDLEDSYWVEEYLDNSDGSIRGERDSSYRNEPFYLLFSWN